VPDVTAAELDRLAPGRIVVLGGPDAIAGPVETALADHTAGTVERLAGATRFETAAEIATERFDRGVDTVYIATGLNWPDALSGGAAAAFEEAPILLVETAAIPAATAAALTALDPGRIVVLDGPDAVAAGVAEGLAGYTDGPVERLAGPTRYET